VRIGIDLRPLQSNHRFRGIGIYIANLVSHLLAIDSANTYVMYRFPGPDPIAEIAPKGSTYETMIVPKRMPMFGYQIFGIWLPLRPKDINVMLVPDINFGLPKGVPVVVTAYDLIPKIFARQQWSKTARQKGLKYTVGTKLQQLVYPIQQQQFTRAAGIVAISQATQDDYLRLIPGLDKAKFTVTPLAAPDHQSKTSTIVQDNDLGEYLFYIGGADYRKNIPELINAYAKVRVTGQVVQLVLAGKGFNDPARLPKLHEAINRSGYAADIITLGYVSDGDVVELLKHARAFIFPSLYEGFGIPVLEAMQAGCPVIAYDNSSIPEIAGDAALLVESGKDMAPEISQVLEDAKLRQSMISKGLAQAKKFSWEATAKKTLEALEKVAK
jgi:glycosyltransferase involved in cell wall biosynthesis